MTSPFMFAARETFKATEFGEHVMDNVAAIAGEIMAEGTAYVKNEAQIHDLQKSYEMVGGIVIAGSLALGVGTFKKVATTVGKFFGKVASKLRKGETNFLSEGRFASSRGVTARPPERPAANAVTAKPKANPAGTAQA